ncbi:centrosomal protein of 126 kDa [Hyperolius riggenbachi]|uniref:centrosomal protein of 126 kDa n=1 Tax=Hyperolius riggenbachi TaxID=752182 RepID=UPI0035A2E6EE
MQAAVMQNQRTKSYSNIQLEIDLEEERQTLLEEQKIIRQRAQKLSVETNRRRKALEEKRREEELREQKFREEVLQQRKIKLQEATEKFQRAHLPPSQRRRTAYVVHRKTPKLEDALSQIQTPLSSPFYYISNHRSPSSTRTSDTSSGVSSIGNSAWPKRQQSIPKSSFDRVFQEKFDSDQLYFQHKLEEAQRLLEEQHLSSLQNFYQEVEQLAHSESLSSLDSLEEEPNAANEPSYTALEFPEDTLHKALSQISSPNGGSDYISENKSGSNCRKSSPEFLQFIPDEIIEQNSPAGEKEMYRDGAKHAGIDTLTQNGSTYAVFSSSQGVTQFSPVPSPEHKPIFSDLNYRESAPGTFVVRPTKAWATPDQTSRETIHSLIPQDSKDMPQSSGVPIKPTMAQPSATPIVVPFPGRSASNCQTNSDLKPNKYTPEVHSINSGPESNGMSNAYKPHLVTEKSDHNKTEKSDHNKIVNGKHENVFHGNVSPPNMVPKMDSGFTQFQKDQLNGRTYSQDDQDAVLTTFYIKARVNSAGKDGHSLLKSILKKGSKYERGCNRVLGIGKILQLGEKASTGIRDSVELVKERENKKNKKLRWLDETDKTTDNKEALNMSRNSQATQKPPVESSTTGNLMEHVVVPTVSLNEQVASATGTPSSVYSTGYHFTKQAWTTAKGEEDKYVGHNQAVRNPPKAKTRVVRRPKSAKAQSAVAYRHRRGVIIRPQSATEAGKIAKTQAKAMVPHPPPKLTSDYNSSETTTEAKSQSVNTSPSQVNNSKSSLSPNYILTRDTVPSQTISRSSGNMIAPQHVENSTKTILTMNSERVQAIQESLPASGKRHPVYGENGLRLDHTPTDEEIALLWQGVRSALTHKNSAPGDVRPGDLPSNVQQTRPNLSHVIIDGGTLSNWRSLSRINGFSSPFVNGYVTLPRRRHIVDSNESKRKALLEQRKGRPGSAGVRPALTQNYHTVRIRPFLSTHEPGQAHSASGSSDVSESTAQFMLAENLVETSATDGEILAAMQTLQANRHRSPNTGHTALSIEEQRLLQSLDRLNQRLHNVQQDTMIKAPAAANGFPMKAALSIHHIPAQLAENAVASHKFRSLSADPRTRLQRRY